MTRDEVVAKMTARCRQIPVPLLADSLEQLDRKRKLDPAERLTRTVLMDVICEKCPAAMTAFDAWADSDDYSPGGAVAAIVGAVRAN